MPDWNYKPAEDHALPPLKRLRSERREPGFLSWTAHRVSLRLLRWWMKFYNRLEVVGAQNLPRSTPFVVVGNHASHIDALVIAAILPDEVLNETFPIAAGDVFFEVPAIAAFAASVINALPMWRKKVGRHALDELKARLRSGECGYILFPEGARTRDGEPLPFKPGIGMMVAGSSVPVVPCRIIGAFEAWKPTTIIPRPHKIRIEVRPAQTFANIPDTREGWNAVSESLRRAIFPERPDPPPRKPEKTQNAAAAEANTGNVGP
ncbi:MAG TPA: lysophospholipid acyltransferase family protein [Phycisphaerales bacterium]|nr:lysophospholipid acyltransferase family protein [Phycisphaerales bacterium]